MGSLLTGILIVVKDGTNDRIFLLVGLVVGAFAVGGGLDDSAAYSADTQTDVDETTQLVMIEDFNPATDVLRNGGAFNADDLRLDHLDGRNGSTVFLKGLALVQIIGGKTLVLEDIVIAA